MPDKKPYYRVRAPRAGEPPMMNTFTTPTVPEEDLALADALLGSGGRSTIAEHPILGGRPTAARLGDWNIQGAAPSDMLRSLAGSRGDISLGAEPPRSPVSLDALLSFVRRVRP